MIYCLHCFTPQVFLVCNLKLYIMTYKGLLQPTKQTKLSTTKQSFLVNEKCAVYIVTKGQIEILVLKFYLYKIQYNIFSQIIFTYSREPSHFNMRTNEINTVNMIFYDLLHG